MKKTLAICTALSITTTALLVSTSANAQFKPGTIMLGTTIGTTAYSSATSDYGYSDGSARSTGTKTYTLGIGPQVGVFLTPAFVLGGTLSYNLNHSTATTTNTSAADAVTGSKTITNTNTVSLGPFLRYYFAGLTGKNWFYGQINGAVGTGTGSTSGSAYTTTNSSTSNGKVNGIFNWNAGGSLGLTHFFYKRIGMDFSLGYLYSHAHSDNNNGTFATKTSTGVITSTTNNYSLNTGTNGITLGVGFHWFL